MTESEYKVGFPIKGIEQELMGCLEVFFEDHHLHLTRSVEYSSALKKGQYQFILRERKLIVHPTYFSVRATGKVPGFRFSDLKEFKPLVEYIEWGYVFLELNKLKSHVDREKRMDQGTGKRPVAGSNTMNSSSLRLRQNKLHRATYHESGRSEQRWIKGDNDLPETVSYEQRSDPPALKPAKGDPGKAFHPMTALPPKTTIDFLIGSDEEKKYLLDYLKKFYSDKKGKYIAIMILVLIDLKLIALTNHTELYAALRNDLGTIGTDSGINKYLAIGSRKDKELLKLVSLHTEKLEKYLANLPEKLYLVV